MQTEITKDQASKFEVASSEVRALIVETLHRTGGGHYGGCLSVIDLLLSLQMMLSEQSPGQEPRPFGQDRVILSKGHSAVALYATLAYQGFIPKEELLTYGSFGSRLQGHPDSCNLPDVDFSTGSLGQGLSVAIGMGLADQNTSRGIWVFLGDGECQEGQVWEAAMLCDRLRLINVWPIVDCNDFQEYGYGWSHDSRPPVLNLHSKWEAFGWRVLECDGHDFQSILRSLRQQRESSVPCVLLANTKKGKGVPVFEEAPQASHCTELTDAQFGALLASKRKEKPN